MSEQEVQTAQPDDPGGPPYDNLWQPIGGAPQSGVPVWLRDGHEHCVAARWRNTTKFSFLKRKWVPTGFWVMLNQAGSQRVPFEPVEWLPYLQ